MPVQFSSSTPAAPAGNVLGHWQYDPNTGTASVYTPQPVIFNWIQGGWNSGTAYAKYDATSYNGSSYVALQPSTNQQPDTATAYWALLAQVGAQGIQGVQGVQGIQGVAGTNGNTVLNGSGAPASGIGVNGDFYIDVTAEAIYGPKAGGAWPSTGTSLVGPQGAAGAATPLAVEFTLTSVSVGTGILTSTPSKRAGTLASPACELYVISSDPSVALAFDIKKNGASIFTASPTLAAGTAVGLQSVGTLLSSIAIALNDVFTVDVSTGSSAWKVTFTVR